MKLLLFRRNKLVLLFTLIMAFFMRGWWQPGLPLTPREENIPQLTDIWSLKTAADQGVLWTAWNPLDNSGAPNLTQRSYLIFAPLAQLAAISHISVDLVYKLAALFAFSLSGLGMYQLLRALKLKILPSLIGALAYMLSPPHITLASDLLDFNFYWATIPWLIYLVERFIISRQPFRHASLTGALLTFAYFAGNTYFLTILPFLCVYAFMRLYVSQTPFGLIIKFSLLTLAFFLATSAFVTLPTAIEVPYTWFSREVTRQQIVDLPSPSQVLQLFPLRWQGHSPLAWDFDTRYPDLSWYLGTVVIILAIFSLTRLKHWWRELLPGIILLLSLTPFFLIMHLPWLKHLALEFLNLSPTIQSAFDRTYRLFLIPSFIFSLLAAFGAQSLLHRRFWLGFLIIILLLFDFFPLSAYFFTAPKSNLKPSDSILAKLNSGSPGRYWSPFTFVKHLSRYRLEYATSYIIRPRVNSEYSYTALAPRYTSELFEKNLFGALEDNRQPINQVSQWLNWGDTRYVLLHRQLFNYQPLLSQFAQFGWQELDRDDNFILLENTGYTNFWHRPAPNHLTASITTSSPTQAMTSESWYPGWQVTINHQPAPLMRANSAFLGVNLPAGQHQIDFYYWPPWYYLVGKLISTVAAVTVIYVQKTKSLPLAKVSGH